MDQDECVRSNCKRESGLIYLGDPLCDYHWEKLCEKEFKEEERRVREKEPESSLHEQIRNLVKQIGIDDKALAATLKGRFGVDRIEDLDAKNSRTAISRLKKKFVECAS